MPPAEYPVRVFLALVGKTDWGADVGIAIAAHGYMAAGAIATGADRVRAELERLLGEKGPTLWPAARGGYRSTWVGPWKSDPDCKAAVAHYRKKVP